MSAQDEKEVTLEGGDALVVVDVQIDFLPGGRLPVPNGDEILPVINRYLRRFTQEQLPIFLTRDWHPPDHCSFQTRGGPWPVHCVAGSEGAQFAPEMVFPPWTVIISKGTNPDAEAYSGFEGTDLERKLRGSGVRRLFVGGLATDYCVLHTVKDALARGFDVFLLLDGIRAVNAKPEDGRNAEEEMRRLGAVPITMKNLAAGAFA